MTPVDDLLPKERGRRPGIARGRIVTPPAAAGDPLTVVLANYSASWEFEIPGSNWTSTGTLPVTRGRCLVLFDDDGDAWIAVYGPPDG